MDTFEDTYLPKTKKFSKMQNRKISDLTKIPEDEDEESKSVTPTQRVLQMGNPIDEKIAEKIRLLVEAS